MTQAAAHYKCPCCGAALTCVVMYLADRAGRRQPLSHKARD